MVVVEEALGNGVLVDFVGPSAMRRVLRAK